MKGAIRTLLNRLVCAETEDELRGVVTDQSNAFISGYISWEDHEKFYRVLAVLYPEEES